MERHPLPVRSELRFTLLRSIFFAQCWLQFVGSGAASGSLPIKEAATDEDGSSDTVSPVRSHIANNSAPGDDSSREKDFIGSIIDDSGLSNAEKSLIGSIVAYTVAFGALSILFCCFLCPARGIQPASVAPHRLHAGSVTSKAGFQGLLRSERMRILGHIFPPVVWSGGDEKKGDKEESASMSGDDMPVQASYTPTNNSENGSSTLDDTNHTLVCSICLNPYQPNCHVTTGNLCRHMFHWDCCMCWLAAHDECPYCRQQFMTDQQFRQAALQVLGESRVLALSGPGLQPNEEVTDQNNSADLNQGGPIDSLHSLPGDLSGNGPDQGEARVRSDGQVSNELGWVARSEDGTVDIEMGMSESQQEIATATISP